MLKKFVGFILILTSFMACQNQNQKQNKLAGSALGTSYHITYFSNLGFDAKKGVDSVFRAINSSMSNYQDDSDISRLNAGDTTVRVDQMFREVFRLSKKIYKQSNGYFDPTVGNLVNAYGFGAQKKHLHLDTTVIDSMMNYVGFDMVSLNENGYIKKKYPEIYIDFNAIGKGYAVDQIGRYLEHHGVKNYLVEVGGEIRARGKNTTSDRSWKLGIDNPHAGKTAQQVMSVVKLENKSLATSGNYRKYRYDSITHQKYVHIVDPKSGFVEKRKLLSISVIADDCATADAYATTFMAMGLSPAKQLAKTLSNIEVYFIYEDQGEMKSYFSIGFERAMVKS